MNIDKGRLKYLALTIFLKKHNAPKGEVVVTQSVLAKIEITG